MNRNENSIINKEVLYREFSSMSEKDYNRLITNAKTDEEKKFYLLVENFFMNIETQKAIASEKY